MDLKNQYLLADIRRVLEDEVGITTTNEVIGGIGEAVEKYYPSRKKRNGKESLKILESLGIANLLEFDDLPDHVGDIRFNPPFYFVGDKDPQAKGRLNIGRGKALIYLLNSIDQLIYYSKVNEQMGITAANLYQQIKYLGHDINVHSKVFSLQVKPQECKLYLRKS